MHATMIMIVDVEVSNNDMLQELGINITKINPGPAHLSQEYQDEFVECICAKDQRESLISKLKSCGVTNADEGVCIISYIFCGKYYYSHNCSQTCQI